MGKKRAANERLTELIAEANWSYARLAAAVVYVADENGALELAATGRSHVSRWASGTMPSGRAPEIVCEALSRRLGRRITPVLAGFATSSAESALHNGWDTDTLTALAGLRTSGPSTPTGRPGPTAYRMAALAIPPPTWWQAQVARLEGLVVPDGSRRTVTQFDVDAVANTTRFLARLDQRHGGGHVRTIAGAYASTDVLDVLRGPFATKHIRHAAYSTAAELLCVSGWTRFDSAEQGAALDCFLIATKLAAEAGNDPLAGHILRAMAHQAIELGHAREALHVAEASIDGPRYGSAAPREKALLGSVYARALGADGHRRRALSALQRAEHDLANAADGDDDGEPDRMYFFGEAALATETACTLWELGDLGGAEAAFRRSVRLRSQQDFPRAHAVTLGHLGSVQIRRGRLEEACATWETALDTAIKVASARTRAIASGIRRDLSPFRRRGSRRAAQLEARARAFLQTMP